MYLAANETDLGLASAWLEAELTEACRRSCYELCDVSTVRGVLAQLPMGHVPPRERPEFATSWLFASEVLRTEGLPRTLTTMVALVAAGDGFTAGHARRIIALFVQPPANDVD